MRSILAVVVMALSAIAIPAHAANSLTVGVAYDIGGRGDKSFNDASAAGLEKAQKQFDFTLEAVVTDGTTADREKRIRALISKNCDPIIAIGAGYAPTLQALSVEFPNTHFAIINDASVTALNVTSLIFADTQGAYLAGFSAAQVSKTGKVAMVANPDQADLFKDGFSAGGFAEKKKVIHREICFRFLHFGDQPSPRCWRRYRLCCNTGLRLSCLPSDRCAKCKEEGRKYWSD
jgi:basic membrane protein A